jgi:hypothetical protein
VASHAAYHPRAPGQATDLSFTIKPNDSVRLITPQITWQAEKNGSGASDIPFPSSSVSRLIGANAAFQRCTRPARRLPIIVAIQLKESISQPELLE